MPILEHMRDACGDAKQATLNTTVCVVGSGPAGAVVAVDLAAAGIDVVILESGSTKQDHRAEVAVHTADVTGRADLRFGFSRQLGGATNLWSGRVAPLDPIDLEAREWVPGSGWPFPGTALEPYYRRAAAVLGIPGHAHFAAGDGAAPNRFASPVIETRVFQWATHPYRAGDHLSAAARTNPHLTLILNAPVTALEESPDAHNVQAARITGEDGRVLRVRARCFVVAAGGIGTPRLLLNSTSVRPRGVGNDRDVVGRYLSTHPKADMGALILQRRISTLHPLFCDRVIPGGVTRQGLGLRESLQRERHLLNHYVQLLPLLEHRANRLFERMKGKPTVRSPLVDRTPLIRGILPGIGSMAFEAMGRLGGAQRSASKFILRGFLDQFPNAENRVTLANEAHGHDLPRVDVRWRFSAEDRASVLAFFDALDADIRARDLGRIEYGPLRARSEWPLIGLHSHYMGTTRMGDDPATSVTTGDARVHGSENLYVAGPSLFPAYGFANPVYTIVALSLRLADHLKEQLK